MSYLSQGSQTQAVQLVVQELIAQTSDSIVTTSASTVTIDCGQSIATVREALFINDTSASIVPIPFSSRVISGTTVTLTLATPMGAHDVVNLYFTVIN